MTKVVSRLAPSPTGALHLGNARTFLINWAMARNLNWELVMRIEDLDGPRIKPGATEACLDLLAWLQIDFDGSVMVQSADLSAYEEAMNRLAAAGLVYRCDLTRSEILEAASAPHGTGGEVPYPAELRPDDQSRYGFDDRETNYRLVVAPGPVGFDDEVAGPTVTNPAEEIGDFVIWTRRGQPSYQLAVVVDDIRQGVTDVVRGDDLIASAGRQMLLYRALGATAPRWWHVPLVLGEDGRRLAKRHGDTRIATYRDRGVAANRVIGLLAWWCGVIPSRSEASADDFRAGFDPGRLPKDPITFTEDDHRWLLGDA